MPKKYKKYKKYEDDLWVALAETDSDWEECRACHGYGCVPAEVGAALDELEALREVARMTQRWVEVAWSADPVAYVPGGIIDVCRKLGWTPPEKP